MKTVDTLTGLRGYAVIIVLISHLANEKIAPELFSGGFGQIGVMIFFVLSAFLMTTLYLDRAPDRASRKSYIFARVGRVLPLYLVMLALGIIVPMFYENFRYPMTNIKLFLKHALMIDGSYELWAVPIEVQFYVVFLLFWWVTGVRNLAQPLLNIGVLVAIFIGVALIENAVLGRAIGLPKFITYFLTGMVIATLNRQLQTSIKLTPLFGYTVSAVVLLSILMCSPALRPNLASGAIWWDPLTYAVVLGTFLCALYSIGIFAWFSHPAMLLMGTISYGFYLIHPVVLEILVAEIGHSPLTSILVVLISVILAYASYQYFEKPTLAYVKSKAAT